MASAPPPFFTVILCTLLIGACSSGHGTAVAPPGPTSSAPCDSVSDTLPPDQSLEGLEDRYRLTLVKTQGVSEPNGTFDGWLYLWRTSSLDSSVATGKHATPGDTTRALYFGTTDVDLDAAEAVPGVFIFPNPPDREDIDPVYPDILGVVRRGVDEGRPWAEFVLLVWTINNRRDGRHGNDGAGVGLSVERVDSTGLFGDWGAWGIVMTGSGYFCARHAPR